MGYIELLKKKALDRELLRKKALREAERLSVLLRKEFEYDTLYIIGSVIKERGFGPNSDIDFVIKGLKKNHFFKALALLIKNSEFNIDLKPWEELDSNSKAVVEREGSALK
jgi:predicted nucleotidyltransferase